MTKLYEQKVDCCAVCPDCHYSRAWATKRRGTQSPGIAALCVHGGYEHRREILPDDQSIPDWCPLPDVEGTASED